MKIALRFCLVFIAVVVLWGARSVSAGEWWEQDNGDDDTPLYGTTLDYGQNKITRDYSSRWELESAQRDAENSRQYYEAQRQQQERENYYRQEEERRRQEQAEQDNRRQEYSDQLRRDALDRGTRVYGLSR